MTRAKWPFLALIIFLVAWGSLLGVEKLYYWRDDWIFLWSNKNNPAVLFNELGGPGWWIKTGVFHLFYARAYDRVPIWALQFSGVIIKTFNAFAVFLVVYSLVRKKLPALLAMILFAAYGGASEAYTWHRITGLAAGFAFLSFAFNNFYLNTLKKKYWLGMVMASILALACYFGRVIGIFPVFILTAILALFKQAKKEYFYYIIFLVLVLAALEFLTKTYSPWLAGSLIDMLKHDVLDFNVYLSNIGNLLNDPLWKIPESGGLIGAIMPRSILIGRIMLISGFVSLVSYLFTKSNFLKLTTICFAWLFLTYLPNWMFAGGGTGTMIGSIHRYFGVSALFLPLGLGIILSKFTAKAQILFCALITISFMHYSLYLMDQERYLHDSAKVLPVYQQIMEETKNDPLPRLIVLDTQLDYISTGWLPYAYGYFKGIKIREDFPPVYSNSTAAHEWICARPENREAIGIKYGAPAYQKDRPVEINHIYAWTFSKDGELKNQTDGFRDWSSACKI